MSDLRFAFRSRLHSAPTDIYFANITFAQFRSIISIKLGSACAAYKQIFVNIINHPF